MSLGKPTPEEEALLDMDRETFDRLRKAGHSPKRIAKAAELLAKVKRGEMTEEQASAIFHGRPIMAADEGYIEPPPQPKQTVREAMETFEAAFDAITEEP